MTRLPDDLRPPAGGILMARRVALVALAVALVLLVPAVSADVLVNDELREYADTGGTYSVAAGSPNSAYAIQKLRIYNIQNYPELAYIAITFNDNENSYLANGEYTYTYTLGSHTETLHLYVERITNAIGGVTGARYFLFFENWNVTGLSGNKDITLSGSLGTFETTSTDMSVSAANPIIFWTLPSSYYRVIGCDYQWSYTIASVIPWANDIQISNSSNLYTVTLTRNPTGSAYYSTIMCNNSGDNVYQNYGGGNVAPIFQSGEIDEVIVKSLVGTLYRYPVSTGTPSTSPATSTINVYVLDSITGDAIANPTIEIYNQTGALVASDTPLWGSQSFVVPRPDPWDPEFRYFVNATAEGYEPGGPLEVMPFAITPAAETAILRLVPTSGGSSDPDTTLLQFYVKDIYANPISRPYVTVYNRTQTANSQGYLAVEVPKNGTYSYRVTKDGYISVSGTATVEDAPTYTVNVVLGSGSVPTLTPTSGVNVTPDSDTDLGDSARATAKSTLLQGLQAGQALFLTCLLMLTMAVLRRGGK